MNPASRLFNVLSNVKLYSFIFPQWFVSKSTSAPRIFLFSFFFFFFLSWRDHFTVFLQKSGQLRLSKTTCVVIWENVWSHTSVHPFNSPFIPKDEVIKALLSKFWGKHNLAISIPHRNKAAGTVTEGHYISY